MGDVALAGAATMEAGGPFPDAEDIAGGSVTVMPVEADVASVEAGMATVEAEAEAVPMVVGADRLHHSSKPSRPTAFAVGRFVGRHWLRLLERFSPDTKQRRRARKSAGSRNPANRQLPERLRGRTQSQAVRCSKDLVAAGAYADIVRQVHPTHRAGGINQEFGGPRNVNRFGAAPNVQEIIKADGLLLGVRKEWEG